MFDNEIISPNIKVKKIRKQILRITQNEIAQGVCSKSLISQIENNNEALTFFIATGIAKNCNRIAKDKNIKIELIKPEDLMKDENSQANCMFEINIINRLNDNIDMDFFEEKLFEAELLIRKYNIEDDKKIKLFKIASNYQYNNNGFNKCIELCYKGIQICFNSNNILERAHFYLNISRSDVEQRNYVKALEYIEQAENINNVLSDDNLFERIYFNKALVYKNMNKFLDSIKCLQILRTKVKERWKILDIKMLYANCLSDLKKFEEAEREYIEILEPAAQLYDKRVLAMAYRNLSELYFNDKKYKDAAINIKESLKNNPHNVYYSENLYFAAKVLKHVNEDVEHYLLEALEICEQSDLENLDLIEKIIHLLLEIYMESEDENNIILMVKKTNELKIDYNLIYSEIVEYYRYKDEEKSINFNIEKIKKIKQDKNI